MLTEANLLPQCLQAEVKHIFDQSEPSLSTQLGYKNRRILTCVQKISQMAPAFLFTIYI